ncbi:hypothetical protein AAG565_07500 [Fontimonas sp. SYSU GA230001]|uniref:hypothetical protein n=1 Tax=Fontimonas sp. SYSU GA230001 TaxID=3142450 RepID=UPI0032B3AD45
MFPVLSRPGLALISALALTACHGATPVPTPEPTLAPVAGYVTDLPRFEAYIATHPTPAEFARVYPDVQLVLPGQMATKELRFNNSRYFAELDAQGRIVGGKFK